MKKKPIDEYDPRNIVQTDFGWALLMKEQPRRYDLLWKREDGVYRFSGPGWDRMDRDLKRRFIPLKNE